MNTQAAAAIVVAGGTGERFGREGGKQLTLVGGRPMVAWAVAALDASPGVGSIVVVCPPGREDEYRSAIVGSLSVSAPLSLVAGGETRQASMAAGLAALPADVPVVLVQDGARPLVTPDLVTRALEKLENTSGLAGVVVGHPAVDTLKVVEGDRVLSTPDRSRFWAVQTPQVFVASVLREAHAAADRDGFVATDDSSLVERTGGLVRLVEGPRDNIKVTTAEDILIVEAALRARESGVSP